MRDGCSGMSDGIKRDSGSKLKHPERVILMRYQAISRFDSCRGHLIATTRRTAKMVPNSVQLVTVGRDRQGPCGVDGDTHCIRTEK